MKLTVGVALLGCGTVGAVVADRLQQARDEIERRSGVRYELRAVAIRDLQKPRPDSLDRRMLTRDARAIVDDTSVDLVVELIGGTTDAGELVERALERGRHVVTANKDLLATQGPRLHALAASRGTALRFEGAVGGAVPIVRTIEEALAGDEIRSVAGVVNGSCTAILSTMERGAGFAEALEAAQHLGYAEADPANDVEGIDAAHKLALIVQLAFGLAVISPRIRRGGIAAISQRDVARAAARGYRIRLVAAAVRTPDGVAAEVAPVLVASDHEFARTSGAENVVEIAARDAGRLVLRGNGAGGAPTCSAVLGDVVGAMRALGGHHSSAVRGRLRSLEPAIAVEPFFARLPFAPDLPHLRIWDDAILGDPVHAVRA